MITVKGNYSKEDIQKLISHTKRAIAGTEPDKYGIATRFWSAVAHSLFQSIFNAFLVKSNHGVDDLGVSWKDLDPKTKAYGRKDARHYLTLYDNRAVKTPSLRVRPTLPPAVNRAWGGRWLGLYLRFDNQQLAGGSTWDYFKAKGYPTLMGLTQNLQLPLLNQSGALQQSLFPMPLSGGIYVPFDKNQIFRMERGKLTIGTKRPHIIALDKDRPLWPKSIGPWLSKAVSAGRDAIYEQLPNALAQL